ncbi:MAG: hypothetical protein NTZ09_01065 [Candidatus Hydrogenedentes bacterium]|nr:hypothetical protein [Candidatus Hydrogenedentota bacterium]
MCLSFLAPEYFRIRFLGEYVFIEQNEQGELTFREVYDVFFSLEDRWPRANILCISPHVLIDEPNGTLNVTCEDAPGETDDDRIIYGIGFGRNAAYDKDRGHVSVLVSVGDDGARGPVDVEIAPFSGRVLVPGPEVPSVLGPTGFESHIYGDVVGLMKRIGTLFELKLGLLEPGTGYALRLVVEPQELRGVAPAYPYPYVGQENAWWARDLSVLCLRNAHKSFMWLLEKFGAVDETREAAGRLREVLDSQGTFRLPLDHHRIMVVSPRGADIKLGNAIGNIWSSGVHPWPEPHGAWRRVAEWASGSRTYWTDDLESFALAIWSTIKAAKRPLSIEETAVRLSAPYPQCEHLIGALNGLVLEEVDGWLYQAISSTEEEKADAMAKIRRITKDSSVAQGFRAHGYTANFTVTYRADTSA